MPASHGEAPQIFGETWWMKRMSYRRRSKSSSFRKTFWVRCERQDFAPKSFSGPEPQFPNSLCSILTSSTTTSISFSRHSLYITRQPWAQWHSAIIWKTFLGLCYAQPYTAVLTLLTVELQLAPLHVARERRSSTESVRLSGPTM